jgi:hypothetical protein
VLFCFQQVHRQRRHERSGKDVRREHGEYYGFGERHKEVAGDSTQEEHRQENDTDTKRRYQGRHGDLCRTFQDGVALGMPFFEISLDVFNCNRSVVHKNSDGEG